MAFVGLAIASVANIGVDIECIVTEDVIILAAVALATAGIATDIDIVAGVDFADVGIAGAITAGDATVAIVAISYLLQLSATY